MTLPLFATTFSTLPARDALAEAERAPDDRARLIVTANIDHVILLSENADFRRAYDRATLRTLDGMPLVWLARLLGHRPVRRITGHDLLAQTLTPPVPPGRRVFLICSTPAVAERMSARFAETGLSTGAIRTAIPPFGFERSALYSARLARAVREHETTLLVLGVGAPKSEIWVDRHASELGAPVCLAVGEAVTVAAGLVPRAPALMQRLGLEWLFRFAHAPRRLFRRYFVRSWRFLALLLAGHARAAPPAPIARPQTARPQTPRPVAPPRKSGPKPVVAGTKPKPAGTGARPPFLKAARTKRDDAAARRRPAAVSSRR